MVQDVTNQNATPDKASTVGTADSMHEEKRKKVGNYIILKTIGEGSFAKVRLGVHLITEIKVAVKVINKREVFKRNYLRANLRREASMMQRLSHPNIVELHEVMETENSYYIVMDLVSGSEFVKYLTKKKQLDENETRKYIRQIVSAVDHMHRAKVVHRDIKLQNFMLDENNDIIIIDFGLSNCLDEKGFLKTQCGSPAYAAPEIFAHQDYGPAVDVWSIGVNMYAMLVGKLPFKVENRSRNLAKLHACILKGCEIPTSLSPDCQNLLSRLLDPSPNTRITIEEILQHPFLTHQLGPIPLTPHRSFPEAREIDKNIIRYLSFKHGYSEQEIEDAVLYRKPIASRAFYSFIERRLREGLGWPDRAYNYSVATTNAASASGGTSLADNLSDGVTLDKLGRQEPLLPSRRSVAQLFSQNGYPTGRRSSRDRSTVGFDEQVLLRPNQNGNGILSGLTPEALQELVPASKLVTKKSFQDIVVRKPTAPSSSIDRSEESRSARRLQNGTNLTQIKPLLIAQRGNSVAPQPGTGIKPRSLPNSTLEHVNQNGFHHAHDSYSNSPGMIRTNKSVSRGSNIDPTKKASPQSPVRSNPVSSVTVKAIGLFLKSTTLHSRVSSCSSKSSKSIHGTTTNVKPKSSNPYHPPPASNSTASGANSKKSTMINYHSQGDLIEPKKRVFQRVSSNSISAQHLPATPSQTTTTRTSHGQRILPT